MTVGGRMIGRLPMVSSTSRPGKRPLASTYPEATPVIPAITVAGTATRSVSRNGPETTPQ